MTFKYIESFTKRSVHDCTYRHTEAMLAMIKITAVLAYLIISTAKDRGINDVP